MLFTLQKSTRNYCVWFSQSKPQSNLHNAYIATLICTRAVNAGHMEQYGCHGAHQPNSHNIPPDWEVGYTMQFSYTIYGIKWNKQTFHFVLRKYVQHRIYKLYKIKYGVSEN